MARGSRANSSTWDSLLSECGNSTADHPPSTAGLHLGIICQQDGYVAGTTQDVMHQHQGASPTKRIAKQPGGTLTATKAPPEYFFYPVQIFAEWIVESLQFGTSRGVTASPKSSRASNRASIPCAHGD